MDASTIGILITVALAWSGLLIGIIKFLLDRNLASAERIIALQDDKISAVMVELRKNNEDMAKLRAELPVLYTRKDDCRNNHEAWIRQVAALEFKFEAQVSRILDKIEELRKEWYATHA